MCADSRRIVWGPLQADAQTGCGRTVAVKFRRSSVLRDDQVHATVSIVVRNGRSASLTIDGHTSLLARHGRETALTISEQHQPAPRVEPRRSGLDGKEVLAEKKVLITVAIKVGHRNAERRRELSLGRKRDGDEAVATIEK